MPNDNKEGRPVSRNQGGLSWSVPQTKQSAEKSAPPEQKLFSLKDLPRPTPLAARTSSEGGLPMPKLVASFVVGLVVGVLGGWMWFSGASAVPSPQEQEGAASSRTPEDTTPTTPTPARNNTATAEGLTVANQPAGGSVSVTGISVTSPTWVAVYDNLDGERGNALGAVLLGPGQTSGTVPLLRSTIAGKSYLAGLRRDNGDYAFSMQKDVPVMNAQGEQLLVQFRAQ